jgi:uncharacterized hydrophobic protein (TIGR00271 family)
MQAGCRGEGLLLATSWARESSGREGVGLSTERRRPIKWDLMVRFAPFLRPRARLSRAFGVSPGRRVALVRSMLEGHTKSAASYWLQLALATGIATLGLALDNTGVVIGAMLVSPLMGPIVALGMGLAVGSALIALRSFLRVVWSLLAVVGGAALITAALPFHEVTREIASRTTPNALDLLVAAFCAVAAALTTVRSASDSATAAAGTAIAIALVPPLCVAGFGIGTASRAIAGGATMLFVANFCAILLLAVVTFLVFGFTGGVAEVAGDMAADDGRLVGRATRRLQSLFGSRYSPALRLLMPVTLLAIVYLPLSRALREVTWQVRTRAAVERALKQGWVADRLVRSSVQVERGTVHVRLLIVGRSQEARTLEQELTGHIASGSGTTPHVEVRAVPDLDAVRETTRLAQISAALPPATTGSDWTGVQRQLAEALAVAWPGADAGRLLGWRMEPAGAAAGKLEVLHLGQALGRPGEVMLGALLSKSLHLELTVRAVALAPRLVHATAEPSPAWLVDVLATLDRVSQVEGLYACLLIPPASAPPARGRRSSVTTAAAANRAALVAATARMPPGRSAVADATEWRLELQQVPCGQAPTRPASAPPAAPGPRSARREPGP